MAEAQTSQYITFFIGDEQFAANAADVSEVFRRPGTTRVPGGPDSLVGLAGLRGMAVPVVSLARLLGRGEQVGAQSRLLLLNGDQSIGLTVDRVGALATLPAPSEESAAGRKRGFGRLYAFEDAALRVLDFDALLRHEFAQGFAARPARATAGDQGAEAIAAEVQVAFLSFELAGQAYALPLQDVSEVLHVPRHMAAIAQSDEAALGVVDLRGRLLPIVSLRALLGLPSSHDASHRLVVTHIGDAIVSLVVDRLIGIVRVGLDAIDPVPPVLNRGKGEAQVQSICRLPDNGGLVAILSAERLFRAEKVAHILADGRGGNEMADHRQATQTSRYLIFQVGRDAYGLPLSSVDQIARLPDRLTRVPNAPAFVAGVLNLRGKVTPVIDQRSRFNADAAPGDARPRIVVTTVAGRQAGFIVDAISEILDLADDQIDRIPEMAAEAGRLFSRIATLEGGERLILLIEPAELLDKAERDLLAGMEALNIAAKT